MSWTPCYERLPEDDSEYLVTCSYLIHDVIRNIDHVVSYVDIRWYDGGSGWSDETVVAWMPLPAAWEDDKGDKENDGKSIDRMDPAQPR